MKYPQVYNMKELQISLWRQWDREEYVNTYQPEVGGWMKKGFPPHKNPHYPPGQLLSREHGWD